MANSSDERSPLLQNGDAGGQHEEEPEVLFRYKLPVPSSDKAQIIDFSKEDDENPRNWPRRRKFINVAIIAFMAGEWRVICDIANGGKAYECPSLVTSGL